MVHVVDRISDEPMPNEADLPNGIRLLPKSALAQAITYVLNQWQAVHRYTLYTGQPTHDLQLRVGALAV
jgi:hypothetical protein